MTFRNIDIAALLFKIMFKQNGTLNYTDPNIKNCEHPYGTRNGFFLFRRLPYFLPATSCPKFFWFVKVPL